MTCSQCKEEIDLAAMGFLRRAEGGYDNLLNQVDALILCYQKHAKLEAPNKEQP